MKACELPFAYASKQVLVYDLSYENKINVHDNECTGATHFHMKGWAPGLVWI